MILAGDIGGTKTLLASCEPAAPRPLVVHRESYASREAAGLAELVRRFRGKHPGAIEAACFGIAGPIQGGRSETPNLPWVVEAGELARLLGLPQVSLINDLEATAYGIAALDEGELVTLNPEGEARPGNAAVIAAGTGLGEAVLYWDGQRHQPFATESGHADFAPRTCREMELLRFLGKEFPRVSYERVISGPGLFRTYRFLRAWRGDAEPAWLTAELQEGDPSAVVTEVALARRDVVCEDALRMFVACYGAEAGNLALRCMAVGGVYLGGGIAPKILPALREAGFMAAFTAKGRFTDFLRRVPVRVICNEETALLGAARRASL
ncbi:MAG: glucokinase [Candidatus Tectomicrobia bacterium]|nr:glucokinase [Candidatus Tectomicrobia bacterium]